MGAEPTGQEEPRDGESEHDDPWEGVVFDESFVRDASVREPSARTRMLTERWKNGGPEPQPWRADEPPAGWIHGTGRRGKPARSRRKRRWFRRKGQDDSGE